MFTNISISIPQMLSIALILLATFLTLYNLIIIPINEQIKQTSFIKNRLRPGLSVVTHNNIQGTVILVLSKTIVLEQKDGHKVEILKQSIKAINE